MRVAHVVPRAEQPWSGILTVIVHLAAALRRQGRDVEVWQLHRWDERYEAQRAVLAEAGVTEVHVAVDAPAWRVGRIAGTTAEERGIDVVHLHGAFNVWTATVARSLRHPYVFSPHSGYDPVSLRRSRLRKALFGLALERALLRKAALVVGLTAVEVDQLRARGARGPAVAIPNGVGPAPEAVDAEAFRRELGLPPGARMAVFVGRLDVHRKGLDRLVEGLAEAPGWHLALVGPRFRDVDRLETAIRELRLLDRVHLVGSRYGPALHQALAAADAFVLLSRWEGLPMALLEALSFGTPAVVSPEVERLVPVAASGAGWVADAGRLPSVLREASSEAVGRADAARALAARYDWDAVAREYGEAYRLARDRAATP
jgi:glycosyltransferase involved in cell wall biosynthesis